MKHRAAVGPIRRFDKIGPHAMDVLIDAGLRPEHRLLDIGAGCLRVGKVLIPYLERGNYVGVEPQAWLLKAGVEHEVVDLKDAMLVNGASITQYMGRFDFYLAQSIFTHAPKPTIVQWLTQAMGSANPKATFVATYCHGDKDYMGHDWIPAGPVRYTTPTMFGMFVHAGWNPTAVQPRSPHPGGHRWIKGVL